MTAAIAYHYHYHLDYIDSLEPDEIKMLIDYLSPPEQKPAQNQEIQDERLARKLALFDKIKEEEAARLT